MANTDKNNHVLSPENWVEKYADSFYSYVFYRTNSEDISSDLVQETFYSALKGKHNFRGDSSEKTWLMSILKNKLMDYYRVRYTNVDISVSQDDYFSEAGLFSGGWKKEKLPTEWNNVDDFIHNNETNEAILNCVERLNESSASVFKMKYFDDNETEFICKELEISKSNYWVIIHRAKLQLRNCLEKVWGFNKK